AAADGERRGGLRGPGLAGGEGDADDRAARRGLRFARGVHRDGEGDEREQERAPPTRQLGDRRPLRHFPPRSLLESRWWEGHEPLPPMGVLRYEPTASLVLTEKPENVAPWQLVSAVLAIDTALGTSIEPSLFAAM